MFMLTIVQKCKNTLVFKLNIIYQNFILKYYSVSDFWDDHRSSMKPELDWNDQVK